MLFNGGKRMKHTSHCLQLQLIIFTPFSYLSLIRTCLLYSWMDCLSEVLLSCPQYHFRLDVFACEHFYNHTSYLATFMKCTVKYNKLFSSQANSNNTEKGEPTWACLGMFIHQPVFLCCKAVWICCSSSRMRAPRNCPRSAPWLALPGEVPVSKLHTRWALSAHSSALRVSAVLK